MRRAIFLTFSIFNWQSNQRLYIIGVYGNLSLCVFFITKALVLRSCVAISKAHVFASLKPGKSATLSEWWFQWNCHFNFFLSFKY